MGITRECGEDRGDLGKVGEIWGSLRKIGPAGAWTVWFPRPSGPGGGEKLKNLLTAETPDFYSLAFYTDISGRGVVWQVQKRKNPR